MANHAWSGTFGELTVASASLLLERLVAHVPDAGPEQVRAWRQEVDVLQSQGAQVLASHPPAAADGTVLEYLLPREGGRRPDVLVLQNGRVVVLEFKQTAVVRHADLDQVARYARDLADYHTACAEIEVTPVLVLCGDGAVAREIEGVFVTPAGGLGTLLLRLGASAAGSGPGLASFLEGEYAPLPSLVAAARLLFENLPLPYIKRAASAGVHAAVERTLTVARHARVHGEKRLVLLTGVPGAGKTLVGLQVAHSAALEEGYRVGERRRRGAPATFLSGNGPLVQVLQHALRSTAFVQDMHRFVREYGLERPDRVPFERLIVFDEAQRAWDGAKIEDFYRPRLPGVADLRRSEPDLLLEVADRVPDGVVVLALVGEGQEIHTGEEGGMAQWAAAVERSRLRGGSWAVHGPPGLAPIFAGLAYHPEASLNLDTSLRAQAAGDLHRWVSLVLDDGALDAALPLARALRAQRFPIYVTQDLEGARRYVRDTFAGSPMARFGLLASSRARNLGAFGVENDFQATKRIHPGRWFNEGPAHPDSCCQLRQVVTEFQCQGLELDLPVVCWGDDLRWSDGWQVRPSRRNPLVHDADRLRLNAYRVLLTRGREGMVLFVPPGESSTFAALVRAGAVEAARARMAG